jgi:hypothetical protein
MEPDTVSFPGLVFHRGGTPAAQGNHPGIVVEGQNGLLQFRPLHGWVPAPAGENGNLPILKIFQL